MKNYVVLDLETTGLSNKRHEITEIGALKVRNKKIVNKFQTLVNPQRKIPKTVVKLTGITNEMVSDKPVIEDMLPDFLNFLGKDVIVAHNATFDYNFLSKSADERLDKNITNDRICTMKLATRLLPDIQNRKLGTICQHYNLVNDKAHRALSDTKVTNNIYLNMLKLLESHKITGREVIDFNNERPAKCRRILRL